MPPNCRPPTSWCAICLDNGVAPRARPSAPASSPPPRGVRTPAPAAALPRRAAAPHRSQDGAPVFKSAGRHRATGRRQSRPGAESAYRKRRPSGPAGSRAGWNSAPVRARRAPWRAICSRNCATGRARAGASRSPAKAARRPWPSRRKSAKAARIESVMQAPLVRAVLDRFPGAEIVAVRDVDAGRCRRRRRAGDPKTECPPAPKSSA